MALGKRSAMRKFGSTLRGRTKLYWVLSVTPNESPNYICFKMRQLYLTNCTLLFSTAKVYHVPCRKEKMKPCCPPNCRSVAVFSCRRPQFSRSCPEVPTVNKSDSLLFFQNDERKTKGSREKASGHRYIRGLPT